MTPSPSAVKKRPIRGSRRLPRPADLLSGTRKAVVVMVMLTLLASGLNYLSSIVFSRLLTPASFGDLTALLALAVVIAVPTGAAQTVVAARVARDNAAGDREAVKRLIRHAYAHIGAVAFGVTLVYCALIPVIRASFDLQAVGPAVALAPLIFVSFIVPVVLGALQGLDRFIAFGVLSLAVAASRLLFGIPWAAGGGGAGGAIAGQAIGGLIVLAVAVVILKGHISRKGSAAARSGLRRKPDLTAVLASGAFIAFACVSNLDIVLAKAFMAPERVGEYAALATIGKILIFLPASIAVVLVPNAARARHDVREHRRALRIAALAVLGTTAVVAIPFGIVPETAIRLMFGDEYIAAAPGVLPMLFAGTGLALLYLLVVYSVAIGDRRWMALLVGGVALQVTGISMFHSSPTEVAVVQATVVGVLLVVNEAAFHSLLRPRSAAAAVPAKIA